MTRTDQAEPVSFGSAPFASAAARNKNTPALTFDRQQRGTKKKVRVIRYDVYKMRYNK